eukprot:c25273_g10_i1 orf=214-2037(+)
MKVMRHHHYHSHCCYRRHLLGNLQSVSPHQHYQYQNHGNLSLSPAPRNRKRWLCTFSVCRRESSPNKHDDDEHLLRNLSDKGQLDAMLDVLQHMDTAPSVSTYLTLLKACTKQKALTQAQQIHAHLAFHHVPVSGLLGDYTVVTLAKCGAIDDAKQLLIRLSSRTIFSWNAMISACVEFGRSLEALELYHCMQQDDVAPDNYTYVSLFKACGNVKNVNEGRKLHGDARREGLVSDAFICSTLISMYGKCGTIVEAENVFRELSECCVVSWNAMLSAYLDQGQGESAIRLYRQMLHEDLRVDAHTYVFALRACCTLADNERSSSADGPTMKLIPIEIGRALHVDAHKKNFTLNVHVGTTLLSMYGKCGTISEAEGVFSTLYMRSVVSWNAMMSQYAKHGQAERALLLYREMQEDGVSPNHLTFVICLQACGTLARKEEVTKTMLLEIGQVLQFDAQRRGCLCDVRVGNTLLSMYGKCGTIVDAEELFKVLPHRDIVSWNVMLSAYVEQGEEEKAFLLYRQMAKESISLDHATLSCTLQACSSLGSLEICNQVHFDVVSGGYDLATSVTAPLLHAYANCASMVDAQAVWNELCDPDIISWTTCIAGYAA